LLTHIEQTLTNPSNSIEIDLQLPAREQEKREQEKSSSNIVARVFWSFYFLSTIAVFGTALGYATCLIFYILALLTKPLGKISEFFLRIAELWQCYSIRALLKLQPWLKLKTNAPAIFKVFRHLGTRKVMFVGNHRSNLDTFLMISLIPGLRGLAKASLFYNVFFGAFMLIAGFIPVKKGSLPSFMKGLTFLGRKILSKNRPVLIFPETTRCEKGFPSVQKFLGSVFQVAIDQNAMVVPFTIRRTDRLLGRGDFFLNPFEPVEIIFHSPIPPGVYSDSRQFSKDVRNIIEGALK
jgi:1-acyl-sn-glycerol-3-phosphate acyltransferase